MRRQLQHLVQMAEMPSVTIQIVPFSAGSYAGLNGPFTLLGLASSADDADSGDTVLYMESRNDQVTRDEPELIGELIDTFWDMERKLASKPNDLQQALAPALAAMDEGVA